LFFLPANIQHCVLHHHYQHHHHYFMGVWIVIILIVDISTVIISLKILVISFLSVVPM
jgi:hypothetical protein